MPTRSDWLQVGLEAVVDDGPNGLRIDRLCRRLSVSKGSFHHHFSGAADFKRSLLAAYEDAAGFLLDGTLLTYFLRETIAMRRHFAEKALCNMAGARRVIGRPYLASYFMQLNHWAANHEF